MTKSYLDPIVTPQEVANFHRYPDDTDELNDISGVIVGAQAYLYTAGAWVPDNPLTKVVVKLLSGHWLENRDLMNIDMKNMERIPHSLTGMIDSLRFSKVDTEGVDLNEEGQG